MALYRIMLYFNSRPSARGDEFAHLYLWREIFQFTPLREGRRGGVFRRALVEAISIHAPPRGATSSSRHVLS